jgi:hypothetical protein
MKTAHTFVTTGLRWLAAAVLAAAFTYASEGAEARTARGGAADLMQSKSIKTAQDLESLQPGDRVAMACPRCKSIYVTTVVKESKPGQSHEVTMEQHMCPGCDHITEVKGHGKMKTEKIVHVCRNCGSKSAFCCVLREGAAPTRGMEESR